MTETDASKSFVQLDNINVTFQSKRGQTEAIRDISFSVQEGEFVTLIGPSGCGKTTVLRLIADVLSPTSGEVIVLGGAPSAARRHREIGYVFQQPALLTWRTVLNNVLLPLEVSGRREKQHARELLELVGLEGFEGHYPDELSGGMQQRVSIARALSFDPTILLMDEPFGALDLITRERMSKELLRIWEKTGKTVVFVTHSIEEAVSLSDRILVLSPRPAVIQAEVAIELPRPRRRGSSEFQQITGELRDMLV